MSVIHYRPDGSRQEVDEFTMIDEKPRRPPIPPADEDTGLEVRDFGPFPALFVRLCLGFVFCGFALPAVLGAFWAVGHWLGPLVNAYCEWAYRLAGGR